MESSVLGSIVTSEFKDDFLFDLNNSPKEIRSRDEIRNQWPHLEIFECCAQPRKPKRKMPKICFVNITNKKNVKTVFSGQDQLQGS